MIPSDLFPHTMTTIQYKPASMAYNFNCKTVASIAISPKAECETFISEQNRRESPVDC
jgi:hypothetical protein